MFFCILALAAAIGPADYAAGLLQEHYNLEAQNCDTPACLQNDQDSLDEKILFLLGRRAALLRREATLQLKPAVAPTLALAAAQLRAATDKAVALGVPKAIAADTFEALIRSCAAYLQCLRRETAKKNAPFAQKEP